MIQNVEIPGAAALLQIYDVFIGSCVDHNEYMIFAQISLENEWLLIFNGYLFIGSCL